MPRLPISVSPLRQANIAVRILQHVAKPTPDGTSTEALHTAMVDKGFHVHQGEVGVTLNSMIRLGLVRSRGFQKLELTVLGYLHLHTTLPEEYWQDYGLE